MMNIDTQLVDDIRAKKVILFAGAGVSMGLGLPSWDELIRHMAVDLDLDPAAFETMGNFLELAEYYRLMKGSIGPLRSWMDTHFHNPNIDIKSSTLHKLIFDLDFPMIYTTNYDRWLERSYEAFGRQYDKIVNVFDFMQTHPGRPQIVKCHGDFDDDGTIVLTESSYFRRLSLDTPLDMKLRCDAMGKSLLFVGYSLSDIDIRYLLYKLQRLWAGTAMGEHVHLNSYIFLARANPVQKRVLKARGIETIEGGGGDPGKELVRFMRQLAGSSTE